jgi:hypothetical protein
MGRCGAIHRRAHAKHTLFSDFQFHGFQAENANTTQ